MAVKENVGTLLHILNEIEVEALPEELPDGIEVDITNLAQVDDQILVSDVKAPTGVAFVTDQGQLVAKIAELVAPEPEPVVEEVAEGEETPEGEAKEEGTSEESTPEEKAE
jgi:large subunit ribosomal protein L25